MSKKTIFNSKDKLLEFLEIKENFLYPNFSIRYREQIIPKKNGGVRTIKPPNLKLKKIQRKILDKILYKIPQLDCVYGLSKSKGIIDNAKKHEINKNLQLLLLDIKSFFPSISQKMVCKIFNKIKFNKENSLILTKLCTVDKSLPQGSPTSPYLASLVCSKLDKKIYLYCKKHNLIYTRYFDDITISGNNIFKLNIKDKIEKILNESGFNCCSDKTKLLDCIDDKIINNVQITSYGLSVTNDYKNSIIDLYKKQLKDNNLQNQRIFSGKFGFYLHINKKEALQFIKDVKEEIF